MKSACKARITLPRNNQAEGGKNLPAVTHFHELCHKSHAYSQKEKEICVNVRKNTVRRNCEEVENSKKQISSLAGYKGSFLTS